MKVNFSVLVLACSALSSALPQPDVLDRNSAALDAREPLSDDINADISDLWKRKRGGGSGGRGGGSTGGGSSGGGGSTGGGGSSAGGRGSTTSSAGGRTTTGSGPPPSYGSGGRGYYGGGAAAPYSAGALTAGGIRPYIFGGALGIAAIYPGLWLYNVYAYQYHNAWTFRNATTGTNQTKPVQCLCEEYQECGCEENDDAGYQASLLGDGTYSGLNKSAITVADLNGTSTLLINGTLPNGTTADGGSDDPNAAGSLVRGMMESSGYWMMLATVLCSLFLA